MSVAQRELATDENYEESLYESTEDGILNPEKVQDYIKRGYSIDRPIENGENKATLLEISARHAHIGQIEMLITEFNADPNLRGGYISPMSEALRVGSLLAVEVLHKLGASIDGHFIFEAIEKAQFDVVKKLVELGVDITSRNEIYGNQTPLMYAESQYLERQRIELRLAGSSDAAKKSKRNRKNLRRISKFLQEKAPYEPPPGFCFSK